MIRKIIDRVVESFKPRPITFQENWNAGQGDYWAQILAQIHPGTKIRLEFHNEVSRNGVFDSYTEDPPVEFIVPEK